jgi:threonine synthase|tara:strand:- start:883 stop:1287 length:405 start_codon:yes stop_codon:yes gene_type:complete
MTSEKMNELKNNRSFSVTKEQSNLVKKTFSSKKINQNEVNDLIKETYKEFNYIMDPHTAIGLGASRVLNERSDNNFILGTAHPIKFSDTVEKAIGHPMQSTNEFFEMYKNEEKFYSFMNSAEEVRKVIKDNYSK